MTTGQTDSHTSDMVLQFLRATLPFSELPEQARRALAKGMVVDGLVKRYGKVTALDQCDFDLMPGEILAVIGDNGAGKSSLIKALSGAVQPDEGEITLEGSYQELTAYLERLEQAKPKLLWGSVSLSADDHPRLVLTLTVYSLSLERAWLIV